MDRSQSPSKIYCQDKILVSVVVILVAIILGLSVIVLIGLIKKPIEDQKEASPINSSTDIPTLTTPVPTTSTPIPPTITPIPPTSTPIPPTSTPTPTPTVFIGYSGVKIKEKDAHIFELDFNTIAEIYDGPVKGSRIPWDNYVIFNMKKDFRGSVSFNKGEPYGYLGVEADYILTPLPPELGQNAHFEFSLRNEDITDVIVMASMHNKDNNYSVSVSGVPPHEPLIYVDRMCVRSNDGHDPVYFGKYEVLVKIGTTIQNWNDFYEPIRLTQQSPFNNDERDFTDWEDHYFRIVYRASDSFIYPNHPGLLRVKLEKFDTIDEMMFFDVNTFAESANINKKNKESGRDCGTDENTLLNIGFELVNHSSVDIRIYKIIIILKPD